MRWASAVSDHPELEAAFAACAEAVLPAMGGRRPNLVIAFISPHFAASYEKVPLLARQSLGPTTLIGCSAGGVIGGGREVEGRPGVSLTIAQMPDVKVIPFHVEDAALPNADAPPREWEGLVHVSRAWFPHFILLADPFTLRSEEFLEGLDYAFPDGVKIGGLSSAGGRPGSNVLYLGAEVKREGVVGVALAGNVVVDNVVAQGCRPIGGPMRVTKCRGNILVELGGRTPNDVLRDLYAGLGPEDRERFRTSLCLGIAMDELKEEYRLGDFLIRNLTGLDREHGGIVVGEMLRENQTVQFHLRDAGTADEDLREMLAQYAAEHDVAQAQGGLLFSCLGRGAQLFGVPDHDTTLFAESVGLLPLGGFFCSGEFGRVGKNTYVHGFTSSFGIFRPRWAE